MLWPTAQTARWFWVTFVTKLAAGHLKDTNWLSWPKFLSIPWPSVSESTYNLVDSSSDPDIQPLVSTLSTATLSKRLGSQQFAKFSSWRSLTCAITCLLHMACLFNAILMKNSSWKGWHYCKAEFIVEESSQASEIIIQAVQEEVYGQEIKCIQKHERIP